MNRGAAFILISTALLCFAIALPAGDALAQQKQRVSFKSLPENTKYPQQNVIEVGDVPNHFVRVYEIHRTFPSNPPMINGVALKEQFTRGISDQIDNNGANTNYGVYVLVNGDKFFTRTTTVAQNNGPGKSSNVSAGYIVGGTGKLAGIKGVLRSTGRAEPKAGINENQTEIEYWIEK